ncbi:putative membrane protein [Actinoplanes campanulatus]|uniref:Putative membrane protein n=1 Tax=Actinoplanes campanulatus TaxID=113559 RepID=A0A7W5ASG4_9ACTN|nr:anthrone oxygenase family protein [Actinoplanes campanulatus]MBB3101460.1 putative membrane protein [Actinoplanes campanulatus]GGN50290.1 membrane protein [Actinoplanes campanulatus]GID42478.1 membrane protein [Actinoplanes campanulatus]
MTRAWDVLTAATVIGSGLLAGVFFAFSAFVMSGLRRLPDPDGAAAMRSLNVTAQRPPLMIALLGVSALCVAMIVRAIATWPRPGSAWLLAGAMLTLVGALGVTAAINVPLNNRLNAGTVAWSEFLAGWNPANHARTVLCLAGCAVLLIGVIRRH